MKKIIIIFSIILLTIITSVIIVSDLNDDNYNSISQNKEIVKNNNLYTMMLETEVGSGEYVESTSSEWPTDDYVLNQRLSGCKNGSEISFDEEKKVIYVSATGNDSCYVYFSKGILFADYIKDLYVSDGDNDLYLHDGIGTYGELEAGDNSYRYTGAAPNNYVCFGSDEEVCPIDNLYRIIGVFDENNDYQYSVKLIKADYIKNNMLGTNGNYYGKYNENIDNYKGNMDVDDIVSYKWNDDTAVSGNGSNNWVTSELNTINLNTNYWNYLGEKWQDKIKLSTWYLMGHNTSAQNPKYFYNIERNGSTYGNNPTTYIDEIGLIYPSDYGYAASPSFWSTNIGSYGSSKNENWMYLGLYEWTITPVTNSSYRLYYLNITGAENGANATSNYTLRPTFYLNTNVTYVSGTGTSSDPYKIQ